MQVAALMMVRDEADIIGHVLDHLSGQVDRVYVMDNRSVDDTPAICAACPSVKLIHDHDVGYWQSAKMTLLARVAADDGYMWVVPVDADEVWETWDGRTVREFLAGVGPDVQVITADLYNHIPTVLDDEAEENPLRRIVWRLPEKAPLPKVACRTHPDLTIHAGNHGCDYGPHPAGRAGGLRVRHYSWRGEDRYVAKIRNGLEAYAATDLPSEIGDHWRMWAGVPEQAIRDHYQRWFVSTEVDGLVYDPYTP
jgi:hypothetical protein